MSGEEKTYRAAKDLLREYEAVNGTNGSSGTRYDVTTLRQFPRVRDKA